MCRHFKDLIYYLHKLKTLLRISIEQCFLIVIFSKSRGSFFALFLSLSLHCPCCPLLLPRKIIPGTICLLWGVTSWKDVMQESLNIHGDMKLLEKLRKECVLCTWNKVISQLSTFLSCQRANNNNLTSLVCDQKFKVLNWCYRMDCACTVFVIRKNNKIQQKCMFCFWWMINSTSMPALKLPSPEFWSELGLVAWRQLQVRPKSQSL